MGAESTSGVTIDLQGQARYSSLHMLNRSFAFALGLSCLFGPFAFAGEPNLDDVFAQVQREAQRHSQMVDEALLANKDARDLPSWARLIWRILTNEPWVTLRVIEDKLRRLDIDIYLMARSTDDPKIPLGACARLPYDEEGQCRAYSLLIITEGRERARAYLEEHQMDELENLRLLIKAGVLIAKPERAI